MKYRGLPVSLQGVLWFAAGAASSALLAATLPVAIAGARHLVEAEPEKIPWIASRVTAWIGYLALTASMVYGLTMTTKAIDPIARRLITNRLHEDLGVAALLLSAAHALLLIGDRYIGFDLAAILIPFTAAWKPLVVGVGTITLYLLALLVLTSKLRRHLGPRLWRALHLLSFAAFAGATGHGLFAGTDSAAPWAKALYLGALFLVLWFTIARVMLKVSPPDRSRPGA